MSVKTESRKGGVLGGFVQWSVVHAAHWALLVAAFMYGKEGALNLIKVLVWVCFVIGPLLLADRSVAAVARLPERAVRYWMSMLQAWVTFCLLVWFGNVVTGLAWLVYMACVVIHHENANEVRASEAKVSAA